LVQEVLVADGDHDLGAEAAGGGQGGGGEGGFAGADQAVEELLGTGAAFEVAVGGGGLGFGTEPRPGRSGVFRAAGYARVVVCAVGCAGGVFSVCRDGAGFAVIMVAFFGVLGCAGARVGCGGWWRCS
jgi:hypothetical protein